MAHDFDRALVKQKGASDETTDKELLDAPLKLRHNLNKWHHTQLDLYPKLAMENDIINAAKPECDSLLLLLGQSLNRVDLSVQVLARCFCDKLLIIK
jgi:hypothetical protein